MIDKRSGKIAYALMLFGWLSRHWREVSPVAVAKRLRHSGALRGRRIDIGRYKHVPTRHMRRTAVDDPEPPPTTGSGVGKLKPRPRRVLVVQDEVFTRLDMEQQLTPARYDVVGSADNRGMGGPPICQGASQARLKYLSGNGACTCSF